MPRMNQILFAVVVSLFIALLGVGVVIPVLPIWATQLGATGFSLGLITAVFSASRGIMQPLVGGLSDQWGRKGFLLAGLFVYGVVGLLIPHATNVTQLVVIRLVQGAGSAMIIPVAMAYASFLAPPGHEGRYMSSVNIAIFCGIGAGPVIGGLLADSWGLASVFYMMAVLCFFAFFVVQATVPLCSPIDRPRQPGMLANFRLMIHRRRTMGILLARFSTVLMMVPTMAFLPVLMAQWPGYSSTQAGVVIASRTVMNAVLQVPFGKLADRGHKVGLLLGGTVCLCLALLIIPGLKTLPAMIAVYLFLGFGEAVLWPVLGAYAAEEGRTHFGHGTMMGVFHLAMSGGVFAGAMVAGTSMDWWGIKQAFYITATAIFVLTLVAVGLIRSGEKSGEQNTRAIEELNSQL